MRSDLVDVQVGQNQTQLTTQMPKTSPKAGLTPVHYFRVI